MQQRIPTVCITHIQEILECSPGIILLKLEAPDIASRAQPGQFVMVKVPGGGMDPLLWRPFSICGVDEATIHVLIQIRGIGTARCAAARVGQTLELIGPLGKGFEVSAGLRAAFLVGGGIGIAPLLFLAQHLCEHHRKTSIQFFMGAASASIIQIVDFFPLLHKRCAVATDDGSVGFKGFVTELLETYWKKNKTSQTEGTYCYGCGPKPFLAALAQKAKQYHVPCQVSLESWMACGVGACMGCVITDRQGMYQRVCSEGPVFLADTLW